MDLLWSLEELTHWSNHRSAEVRYWAVRNLIAYYPEQSGAALATRLQDEDTSIAASAARYFRNWPGAQFGDALLAAFERTNDPVTRGNCAQALARIPDARFAQRYWDEQSFESHPLLNDAEVLDASMQLRYPAAQQWLRRFFAEAEGQARRASRKGELKEIEEQLEEAADYLLHGKPAEEIPFLIDFYLRWPNHESIGYRLLSALAGHAGVYSTPQDFEEETHRSKSSRLSSMEEEELEELHCSWETDVANRGKQLLKEGQDLAFISLLAGRAEALFREDCAAMSEAGRMGWLENGQIPAFNLQLLRALSARKAEIASAKKPVRHRLALVALATFSRYVMCRPLLGRSFEELASAEKLQFLLRDRYGLSEDEAWIRQLRPDEASLTELKECCAVMGDSDHRGQERAAILAGHFRYVPALPLMLDLLATESDFFWEDLLKAAARFGEAGVPFLEEAAREENPERLLEMVPLLSSLPCLEAEQFLVSQFSRLYDLDADSVRLAVETFGTRRLIPLVRGVMKPGEPEEEIYALLGQLHEIADPELPRIVQAVRVRREESERQVKGFLEGDVRAGLSETIPLNLKCRQCGKAYHYDVHRVHVDPGAPPDENIFVQDSIVCKNCGAEDAYEITGATQLAIMGALLKSSVAAKAGQGDPQEGPVRMVEATVDGKHMTPSQGDLYYRDQIAQHPNRPDLRAGYANLLHTNHQPEPARREYEKALELDPLAVEAWVSLGEIERKAGNLSEARDFYSKALTIFDRGNFYRLTEHREDFREQLEINLDELSDQLVDEGIGEPFQDDWIEPLVKLAKVGRNDPCPCGSGRKYKKCCLGKEESAGTRTAPELPKTMTTAAEARLQQRLTEFSTQPRFKRQFDQALQVFFGEQDIVAEDAPLSHAEFGQFLEWFIHDYTQESGGTLLDIFQRTDGRLLPAKEKAILEEQRKSVLSAYEVLESHPERAEIRIRDLFTDEELVAHDVAGSQQLVQWDIIISRLMRVEGRLRLSGIISKLPPAQRNTLFRYANLEKEAFQQETGKEDLRHFLKARGYCLHQFVREEKERYRELPELHTSDHNAFLICKGSYRVQNYHGAAFRLQEAPDFDLEEAVNGAAANALRFVWLKRGPSRDVVPEGTPQKGVEIQTARVATPYSHPVAVLGTVTLSEDEMVLETLSRERLQAGRQRLQTLLGGYVAFKLETLQAPEALRATQEDGQKKTSEAHLPTEGERRVVESMLRNHYERWIDEPLPALDGKTPRQAVATVEGRAKVEELIKSIENIEARKRLNQEISVDLSFLRQRLSATAK
jgi:SEC-C motif/Protein of unknown function (DUF2384)